MEAVLFHNKDMPEEVESLGEIVHKKTEGDSFFVIFFLRSLQDDELLEYNFAIARWHWDEEKINEKVMTENVASIMVNKLRRFKNSSQNVINVASPRLITPKGQGPEIHLNDGYTHRPNIGRVAAGSKLLPDEQFRCHILIGRCLAATRKNVE